MRAGRAIFANVDFSLAERDMLVLTGRNGSGKSSLLRMVAGLLPAATGELGLDDGGTDLTIAEQAHYLGHLDPVKPSLSVGENLRFWQDCLGGTAMAGAAALARVGLDHLADIPGAYLSAGQRRRLSLARLLAVPRPIWLLDEPTSALDTAGQSLLSTLLAEHLAGGGIVMASTHAPLGLARARELRIDQYAVTGGSA